MDKKDPEYSIQIGVKYFADVMKQAKGDVHLALQSYNFRNGFIGFALERRGYSKEVATEFSLMMAAKMGWSRYGDVDYVEHVLRYYDTGNGRPEGVKMLLQELREEVEVKI